MPIIQVIVVLIVVGFLLWLLSFLPMDAKIKGILNAVVILLVVLWILGLFFPGFTSFRIGR